MPDKIQDAVFDETLEVCTLVKRGNIEIVTLLIQNPDIDMRFLLDREGAIQLIDKLKKEFGL
jgi:hypothetical protein